jgi:hypothetical protein
MQQIEPALATRSDQRRTLRFAWLSLLGFSLLFAALVGWAGLAVRHVYRTATVAHGAILFVRGATETVAWKPADRTIYQGARDQGTLAEGDSLRIATSAVYGQVASVRLFDDSQLDLWAGAEVTLESLRTSRWHSDTLEVTLSQQTGYVRYDIKPVLPYGEARYTLRLGDATVILAPGGSYSVEMRSQRSVSRPDGGNIFMADVAVRAGSARVLGANGVETTLRERERLTLDPAGNPGLAVPARWELVRDGGFSQYGELLYNNTTLADLTAPRSDTWQVYGTPELPQENRGYFRLSQICRPPEVNNYCDADERRTAAWFYRVGGQTTGFTTGIEQEFGLNGEGVDISEFRSLKFSFWTRVLGQSLRDVGDRGSECPVMVRLLAKRSSPADPEEERVICIYTSADDQPLGVADPGVRYYRIDRANWHQFSFDLRAADWLPDYRYLRSIQIYANGHDYDSRVAEVSIIGEQ